MPVLFPLIGNPLDHFLFFFRKSLFRQDFLEQVVLHEFNRLAGFAEEYEDDFVKAIIGHSMKTAESDRGIKQRELDNLLKLDNELDKLFEWLYEDICCKGRLSKPSYYSG